MKPDPFRTITGSDWVVALRAARKRRAEAKKRLDHVKRCGKVLTVAVAAANLFS